MSASEPTLDSLRAADMAEAAEKFEAVLPDEVTGYVRVYRDKQGGHRFRVRARNGEVVLPPESYTERNDALEGFQTLREVLRNPLIDVNG